MTNLFIAQKQKSRRLIKSAAFAFYGHQEKEKNYE